MKRVIVSQRIDAHPIRNEQRDALDQRLIDFLLRCKCLPIPIPNNLLSNANSKNILLRWVSAIQPNAVILSGGNDIGVFSTRDSVENELLDHAERHKLPVLGICRGMQMMAIRAGGKLRTVKNHVKTRHLLKGEINREVNSYHNFSLSLCPTNYSVIASSIDAEIEAIRHNHLPWEGWMWHPERDTEFNVEDIARLELLLNSAKT